MNMILKVELGNTFYQDIEVPKGSRFLSLQVQNNKPVIYVVGDRFNVNETWHIEMANTGDAFPTGDSPPVGHYLGTAMIKNGNYVAHYFKTN